MWDINLTRSDIEIYQQLEVGISGPGTANRLLIFTGSAKLQLEVKNDDSKLRHGKLFIDLDYPLSNNITLIESATVATLSSIMTSDNDEIITWAIDNSVIIGSHQIDPADPTSLTKVGLFIQADVGIQGGATAINRISYQANVVIQYEEAELKSILIEQLKHSNPEAFTSGPLTNIPYFAYEKEGRVTSGNMWRFKLTLTGPATSDIIIVVSSANNAIAPLFTIVVIPAGHKEILVQAPPVHNHTGGSIAIFITATHKAISSVATLIVDPLPFTH